MRKIDRGALRRALKIAGRKVARGEDWGDAATGAAYHCQMEALRLRPWQWPPMWADDDRPRDDYPTYGRAAAWELRRRLIAAGLSVYEPDPVRALETVAARQRSDDRASASSILVRTGPAG